MWQAESPEDVETDHRPAEGSQGVVDLGHEPAISAAAVGRAGHDEVPISKHASQSRHNARRRSGKCDSAVPRVWRMWTRVLSALIERTGRVAIRMPRGSVIENFDLARGYARSRPVGSPGVTVLSGQSGIILVKVVPVLTGQGVARSSQARSRGAGRKPSRRRINRL